VSILVIRERLNVLTGQPVRVDPPAEIDEQDLDWLQRMWQDTDALDWEIMRASAR
jgi:hypothetical protein